MYAILQLSSYLISQGFMMITIPLFMLSSKFWIIDLLKDGIISKTWMKRNANSIISVFEFLIYLKSAPSTGLCFKRQEQSVNSFKVNYIFVKIVLSVLCGRENCRQKNWPDTKQNACRWFFLKSWPSKSFNSKSKSTLQGRPYVRKRSILLIAIQLMDGAKIF